MSQYTSTPYVCFLTSIDNKRYDKFVLPFLFSTLQLNRQTFCEILTNDVDRIESKYKYGLDILRGIYGLRFLIRQYNVEEISLIHQKQNFPAYYSNGVLARFFSDPVLWCKFTYVTDIDIFFTDAGIGEYYEDKAKGVEDTHFNPIRMSDSDKMCGTYCVKTNEFYTDEFHLALEEFVENPDIGKFDNDEKLLKFFFSYMNRLPSVEISNNFEVYRKMFGIHTSLNRPPRPRILSDGSLDTFPTWDMTEDKIDQFNKISATENYKAIFPFFDDGYKEMIEEFYL